MKWSKPHHLYPNVNRLLRPLAAEQLKPPMFKGPPHVTLACRCGKKYSPPWSKRLPDEYSHVQDKCGKIFALSGLPIPCPNCSTKNLLIFPEPERNGGHAHLYGDESSQWISSNVFIYCYAFVAFDDRSIIHKHINDIKLKLCEYRDPDSWILHTLELRGQESRAKIGINLRTEEINAILSKFISDIGSIPGRFISVIAAPLVVSKRKSSQINHARNSALTAGIYGITEFMTRNGNSIDFTLESQNKDHDSNGIDNFVETIGRSFRYDLGYLYISHGKYVGLPVTEPKGAAPELEAADVVAYVARRHFYRRSIEQNVEIPIELLGNVFWGAFSGVRFGTSSAVGFPWEHFYPGIEPYKFQ